MINVLTQVMVPPFPTLEMKVAGFTSKRKVANDNRIEKTFGFQFMSLCPRRRNVFLRKKEINGDRLIMALPSPDQTFPPVQRVAIKRVIPCPKLFSHKSNPLFYPPQLFGLIRSWLLHPPNQYNPLYIRTGLVNLKKHENT